MKLENKSQVSTEVLVILAVMLLVVTGVIAVASGLPLEISNWSLQKNKQAWYGAPVGIVQIYEDAGADLIFIELVNNQKFTIELSSVSLDGTAIVIDNSTLTSGLTRTLNISSSSFAVRQSYMPEIVFSSAAYGITGHVVSLDLAYPMT